MNNSRKFGIGNIQTPGCTNFTLEGGSAFGSLSFPSELGDVRRNRMAEKFTGDNVFEFVVNGQRWRTRATVNGMTYTLRTMQI